MLTKEERAAIAYRIKDIDVFNDRTFYTAITGKCVPKETSYRENLATISRVILDLCDTSNMLELPLDKDGEVIRVGDTVYVDDDVKYEVVGYMMRGNSTNVILAAGTESVYTKEPANNITHKKPVTIKSLNKQLRYVVKKGGMTSWSKAKLSDIANQLEKLGDSDE